MNVFNATNSKGRTYYLHGTMSRLKNGIEQPLYYFRKTIDTARAQSALPDGYEVMEAQNGMLFLKKAGGLRERLGLRNDAPRFA